MSNANFYSQARTVRDPVASVAQLPNVSGATIQDGSLQQYDQCTVGGATYYCTTPTLGAAVWSIKPQADVLGNEVSQTASTATLTVLGGTTVVYVTTTSATAITLPTVAAGAPIGTKIVIHKTNTGTAAINVTPDAGATINVGVADAAMAVPATTASSTTTLDVSVTLRRTGALTWRMSAC